MIRLLLSILAIIIPIILKKPVYLGLIIATSIFYITGLFNGFDFKTLNKYLVEGILSSKNVLFILALISILTSLWMACGTIPYLMYLGLGILSKYNFVFFTFFIMSIVSYTLGTAVGSISTIGIVLINIGGNIGIDTSILAGAIVSGAFLGDRSSPLSSCLNLTINVTGSDFIKTLKKLNLSLFPTFIICSILYFFIGTKYYDIDFNSVNLTINQLSSTFNLNIYCIIPVIILFLFILLRFNISIAILLSILSSFVSGILFQNTTMLNLFKVSLVGYKVSSSLNQGGFISMYKILLTIVFATMFTRLLQESQVLNSFIQKLQTLSTNQFNLILNTGFLSILLNIITCSQVIGILLPSIYMKNCFIEKDLHYEDLAHTISDLGNITVPLIPWNINSIVASTLLGVSSLEFIPYAFLCYLLPLFFIFITRFKFNKLKITT